MNVKTALILMGTIVLLGVNSSLTAKDAGNPLVPLCYGKTYSLTNRTVEVVIAPETGRIIHFGFCGERNIIWLKDQTDLAKDKINGAKWLNWGGDKVWPAQQADWPFIYGEGDWPPKTALDREPFTVLESSDRRLVMESAVDNKLHVKLQRILNLDAKEAKLTIENRLIRVEASAWPVQIWSITQSTMPKYTLLGISKKSPDLKTRPFLNLWNAPLPEKNTQLLDNALRLSLDPGLTIAKAGTIGKWCAAVYDDVIFLQKSDSPYNGCYPDGASAEAFMCDHYTELEILGPSLHLKKGESLVSTTSWYLIKTNPDLSSEDNRKLIKNRISL